MHGWRRKTVKIELLRLFASVLVCTKRKQGKDAQLEIKLWNLKRFACYVAQHREEKAKVIEDHRRKVSEDFALILNNIIHIILHLVVSNTTSLYTGFCSIKAWVLIATTGSNKKLTLFYYQNFSRNITP